MDQFLKEDLFVILTIRFIIDLNRCLKVIEAFYQSVN